MKNDKDIIALVKSRSDVMLVEERMPTPPKSRRDVMLVKTPTVIRLILRYGLTFCFVQYPYHVPELRRGEEMLFYQYYIPDGIDFQGYYANLSSIETKQSKEHHHTGLLRKLAMTMWQVTVLDDSLIVH